MSIESISGAGGTVLPAGATRPGNVLGKEQFLSLLLTQMQMQDPFEPLKNEDMIAQLAQFSSLEQLQNMNDGLQQSLDVDLMLGQLLSNTMATTLIGKEVHVGTDAVQHVEGKPTTLGYRLHGAADAVKVSVYDPDGKLVATLEGQDHAAGSHSLEWDGRDAQGNVLPAGRYTFKVEATHTDGSSVDVDELLIGRVTGIRYADGNARVLLGDTEILMSQIEEILG